MKTYIIRHKKNIQGEAISAFTKEDAILKSSYAADNVPFSIIRKFSYVKK